MSDPRSDILDWAAQGRIAPGGVRRAFGLAAALPGAGAWRRFLDRLLLYMGVVLLAAALVFFFAYNWQALGRFGKFALVEVPLLGALALLWRTGLESLAGRATLLFAALLVGALLALVGQTYQTGADTFELFAAWAAAIAPWVLLARAPALWILWLALANVAVALYFHVFPRTLGIVFGPERQLWLHFALNTAALALWEGAAASGVAWLRERWAARLLATASGGLITALALKRIFDDGGSGWALAGWAAWAALAYAAYRHWRRDLFVLAGGALSAIVVLVALLARQMSFRTAGEFLFLGMVVIALSGAAGYWLRLLAAEERR